MALQTIHLDGADFQAEPHVIAALGTAQTRCDELSKQLDKLRNDAADEKKTLETKCSTLQGERDTLQERLDAMEKEMPVKISAAVQSRLELVGKAQKAGVEVRNDMADLDIKKAVILKKFPSANLDGKDDAYVNARFDCACDLIDQDGEAHSRQDAAEHVAATPSLKTAQERLEESKRNYNARLDNAWQDDNPNK